VSGSFDRLNISGAASLEGHIDFSLLPGYDIAAEIGPYGSRTVEFLTAGDLQGMASVSISFPGGPLGIEYTVWQQDRGLFLQAVNTIPEPTTVMLVVALTTFAMLGGWLRKRSTNWRDRAAPAGKAAQHGQ
jgi:hypothetical protein